MSNLDEEKKQAWEDMQEDIDNLGLGDIKTIILYKFFDMAYCSGWTDGVNTQEGEVTE